MAEQTGNVYGHKIEAYNKTAEIVKVAPSSVRTWVQDYEVSEFIAESKRGRHSKTSSPIIDDPNFREKFKNYVRKNSREPGTLVVLDPLLCKVFKLFIVKVRRISLVLSLQYGLMMSLVLMCLMATKKVV